MERYIEAVRKMPGGDSEFHVHPHRFQTSLRVARLLQPLVIVNLLTRRDSVARMPINPVATRVRVF